jgi:hypothetical protein
MFEGKVAEEVTTHILISKTSASPSGKEPPGIDMI